jgi:hypothetical protein
LAARSRKLEASSAHSAEYAGHGRLHVRVEGGVLDLVDLVEGDQAPTGLVGEALAAEQLAEELEETADRLVVTLGALAERVRMALVISQDEVDVPREQRVDLDELLLGDGSRSRRRRA